MIECAWRACEADLLSWGRKHAGGLRLPPLQSKVLRVAHLDDRTAAAQLRCRIAHYRDAKQALIVRMARARWRSDGRA